MPFEGLNGCEAPSADEADMYGFCRVSTGDSDMPSSCGMKDEPEFKPLQGNRAFFESGPLGVHSTCDRKHRIPLTVLLVRENSS